MVLIFVIMLQDLNCLVQGNVSLPFFSYFLYFFLLFLPFLFFLYFFLLFFFFFLINFFFILFPGDRCVYLRNSQFGDYLGTTYIDVNGQYQTGMYTYGRYDGTWKLTDVKGGVQIRNMQYNQLLLPSVKSDEKRRNVTTTSFGNDATVWVLEQTSKANSVFIKNKSLGEYLYASNTLRYSVFTWSDQKSDPVQGWRPKEKAIWTVIDTNCWNNIP